MRFSISLLRGSAAALGLALFACGGDGPTEPPTEPAPIPAAIALVSGNDQEGKAGERLSEPFALRVTDAQGGGVEGVEVTWRVASGAGDFAPSGDFLLGTPERTMRTDADGIARVWFRPWVVGTSMVAADVEGLQGSPVTFTAEADSPLPPVSASARAYERVSGYSESYFSVHGSLYERYVLHEDGTFGLQFSSGTAGFFEFPGAYAVRTAGIAFSFDDNPGRWTAIGTFRGECLVVEYNLDMFLSDFADGEYCPPAETP